jgi:hypothetical protein
LGRSRSVRPVDGRAIARDENQGRTGRTVRELIAEIRGLARSGNQKLVLAAAQASGVLLQNFFAERKKATQRLLIACKIYTKTERNHKSPP